MTDYLVIYERAEDGAWGAYLPDVPGVVALGSSRDEVAARIRTALDAYVDELRAAGEPLPPPQHAAETVSA